MEEKNVLNEKKTEEVSGGRWLSAEELSNLDPTKKQAFLESLKKLEPKPTIEIPEDLLNKISGGSVFGGPLDDWDMNYLDNCINFYKSYGYDLETMLNNMLSNNLSNEAMWYVGTHW